ncbi:methylated-DNA--[protein]-cysteine S-methyltransferase [Alphaproteobacteria bacterium]|nr:methylated-DNA--[protein]-cysteine S-methyltransferase [Alphaproteobacteria bacterium]
MEQETEKTTDFAIIEKAIVWLADRWMEQPSLDDLADRLGISVFALQKIFKQWAGVSPEKFLHYLTLAHAKECLAEQEKVMIAGYDEGLPSPGRLNDLSVSVEAMTSGEWKQVDQHLVIRYGWHPSPFGDCLIAATDRGVCGLAFVLVNGRPATEENLFVSWKGARIVQNFDFTGPFAVSAFCGGGEVPVVLRGTPFQLKVWESLLHIPSSKLVSYEGLAMAIGKPGGARAVASAVARNPVSWLIPCHRVIRQTGVISGYRWGPSRKRAILAWEASMGNSEINVV